MARGNFLVIVADDISQREFAAYAQAWQSSESIPTPHVDELASTGLVFRYMHANPVCSSTRATLMTGQYGFRTGIGKGVKEGDRYDLPKDIATLPRVLREAGYRCGAIGKWHLSSAGVNAPREHGFHDYVAGSLHGGVDSYTSWDRIDNGRETREQRYATQAQAHAAAAWIDAQNEEGRPWFAYLAFNTPHKPFHWPPPASLPASYRERVAALRAGEPRDRDQFVAAIVAMDHAIGQLLERVDLETTTVVFLADNGTPTEAAHPDQDPEKLKATLFREGVEIPFVVAGRGVESRGGECTALANTTDLFATLVELADAKLPPEVRDSVSLVPYLQTHDRPGSRPWVYFERFYNNAEPRVPDRARCCIREPRFKYMTERGVESLYDLEADPLETKNLLAGEPEVEAARTRDRLRAVMDELHAG